MVQTHNPRSSASTLAYNVRCCALAPIAAFGVMRFSPYFFFPHMKKKTRNLIFFSSSFMQPRFSATAVQTEKQRAGSRTQLTQSSVPQSMFCAEDSSCDTFQNSKKFSQSPEVIPAAEEAAAAGAGGAGVGGGRRKKQGLATIIPRRSISRTSDTSALRPRHQQ